MTKGDDRAHEIVVPVFTANDEFEARMIQELLRNHGIESTINAETAPGLFPVNTGDLAKHDILVLESQVERAMEIISEVSGPEANGTSGEA